MAEKKRTAEDILKGIFPKKSMTTEEELRGLLKRDGDTEDTLEMEDIDRFVELIIDIIAERADEKAEEAIDRHERNYDHDWRHQ